MAPSESQQESTDVQKLDIKKTIIPPPAIATTSPVVAPAVLQQASDKAKEATPAPKAASDERQLIISEDQAGAKSGPAEPPKASHEVPILASKEAKPLTERALIVVEPKDRTPAPSSVLKPKSKPLAGKRVRFAEPSTVTSTALVVVGKPS